MGAEFPGKSAAKRTKRCRKLATIANREMVNLSVQHRLRMDLGQPFHSETHLVFHQSELPGFPVKESLGMPGEIRTPNPQTQSPSSLYGFSPPPTASPPTAACGCPLA